MKSFALAALMSVASAQNMFQQVLGDAAVKAVSDAQEMPLPLSSSIQKNSFGYHVEETVYANNHVEKLIKAPLTPFHVDYTQQEHFLNQGTAFHQNLNANGPNPTYTCDNREPGGTPSSPGSFFPVLAGELTAENPSTVFTGGKCFEEITMQYFKTSDTTFDIFVKTDKPKSKLCSDTIMFGNTEIQHFEVFYFKGTHKLSFEMNTPESQADVGFGGIKAFSFCEGIVGEIEGFWNFAKCFLGGLTDHTKWPIIGTHVPPYMEKANLVFLDQAVGIQFEERETQKVEINPDLIQSGDFLAIMRLDGLDPIIMYGTGSHIGHSTMALRFDGELYVVESQDAWYWPTHGLQRTLWADWIKQAEDASFHVSWLPMRKEIAEKFDEAAAQKFFFDTEGLPYGYHNFLYGWIDTAEDNWPPLIAKQFIPIVFSVLEKIAPKTTYNFYTEALNKRLGVDGKNIAEMAELAAEQNMSLEDVMAMVEMDGWIYDGELPKDGLSYVCSAYVAAMYKAAGLFDDLNIQATEFSPRDVYSLNFYDLDYPRPQACVDADPNLPYCQILGKYRMELPEYSANDPYENMYETCTINWPEYTRDPGC